jgi:predicted nuclease with TOPRIM domain
MVCGILKGVVRTGLIVALVGGAAAVVAGPHRVHALVDQARGRIQRTVDRMIDDPVALRAQLRELEGQYPARISEVRGDLEEVNRHLAQLHNHKAESLGVVELTSADLGQMQGLLAQAEEARAGAHGPAIVRVSFNNQSLDVADAYAKANRLTQIRDAYQSRAEEVDREVGYVAQQRDRLAELLAQLETEQAEFQAQLWQLDRQIDTVARNDRMIAVLKKRECSIEKQSRYDAGSLGQITGRLEKIRAEQEGKLEQFRRSSDIEAYENAARFKVNGRASKYDRPKTIEVAPTIIQIQPSNGQAKALPPTASKPERGSERGPEMAFR